MWPKFVLVLFAPVLFIFCPNKNQPFTHQILLAKILSNLGLEDIQKAELWVLCYFYITSDNAHFTLNITGPGPYVNSDWHTEETICTERNQTLCSWIRRTLCCLAMSDMTLEKSIKLWEGNYFLTSVLRRIFWVDF